jgi:hypothetical protein
MTMPGSGFEKLRVQHGSIQAQHGSGGKKLHTITLTIPQAKGNAFVAQHRFAPPHHTEEHVEHHNLPNSAAVIQHIAQHVGHPEANVLHRGATAPNSGGDSE